MFTDFPLGNTAGPPGAPDVQLDIVHSALGLAHSAPAPGTIVPLDHQWHEPWKDEARELIDHRTPRLDTPQYERMSDMAAAVDNHGEELACGNC